MSNKYRLKLISLFLVVQFLVGCNSSNVQEKENMNMNNVKVQLSYPSEGIPPLSVYLKDINSGKVYMYENDEGLTLINFEGIPDGEYVAFAYTKEFILGNMKAKGSYSYAVDCGLTVDCKNNRLKKCLINNEYSDTIKIFDWYHEEDIPSEPTSIVKKFGEKKKNESANSDNHKMVFIPVDINSEFKKVTVEKLNNQKVNLTQYYKNGEEVSEMGMINNGIIDLDEPDREDIIEINENNLTIENQWVGRAVFELK